MLSSIQVLLFRRILPRVSLCTNPRSFADAPEESCDLVEAWIDRFLGSRRLERF